MPGHAVHQPVRITFSFVEEEMEGQETVGLGFAGNCCENRNAGASLLGKVNGAKVSKARTITE